ncbi:hypothetical protein Celaphus_00015909 [Cervus elaphus hippelaphus]|uniref:Uncharacterized protein n=1 Tax=Cervus elaphus hippelaphus TaxID=46360 RepID=A0A212C1A9_CEREH|nr:hypothetical protein Celaphus_00015909 [Cervus elaphus hippelaphus]
MFIVADGFFTRHTLSHLIKRRLFEWWEESLGKGKQKLMLSLRMNTMTTTHSGPLSLPSVDPDIYH